MKLKKKNIFLSVLRILMLFIAGLVVAVVLAFSRVNLESLRGNVVSILRDATGLPIEIDGAVSWRFSVRPRVELYQVRVANADWAKQKDAFSAEKIVVRLNLISLFKDRPTIQNVRVHNAKINLEQNENSEYSIKPFEKIKNVDTAEMPVQTDLEPEKYPFSVSGLGGVEIRNLVANILGEKYSLAGFNIRLMPYSDKREYSGWIKAEEKVFPFIISLSEYNAERKIYPVQVAMSMGGDDALIANVALEGKSKVPIDFVIKGDIPDAATLGRVFNLDLSDVPSLKVNIAGGLDRQKITLRKSSLFVRGTDLTLSGTLDWGKANPVMDIYLYSPRVDLAQLFPNLFGGAGNEKKRKLNVFKDIPLFGKEFLGKTIKLHTEIDDLVIYRDLNLADLDLKLNSKDNYARLDIKTGFAEGDVTIASDINIANDGRLWIQMGALGERIYIGDLLSEIHKSDLLSELPVNLEMYVQANGENLSQVMQTITGPVRVYSVGAGYMHSALVSYMYGADFLTNLRHSIQDLFRTEKKHNQIKVSCVALNVKLRDGKFETQNGFAIETNAINVRLAGNLNLGGEEMRLALTTVPVRGLKLSLTGNVVNSIELTGSLAEPDIKISGAAMAGKVASATGLGLLLAPFTGGIGLVAGTGVGLLAGDLLENWLADSNPCETALERGAPAYRDDPEWLDVPMAELVNGILTNK